MSSTGPAYSIRSSSSGKVGRALNQIRNHHIVVDSPSIGEEITSGEAFLLGVSACGVTLVEGAARELGFPVQHTEVTIEGYRAEGRPAFERVDMRFVFTGPTQEQAETLVQRYKDG
jgi:uncharacterized OsmC-like protein